MKLPLKVKATLMIVMISLLIGIAGIIVYSQGINRIITEEYETRSVDISSALAEILDADQVKTLRDNVCSIYETEEKIILSDQWGTPEFEEYISHYSAIESSEAFRSLREQLRQVQDVIKVDCLYIIWFDVPRKQYVYLVDGAHEDACPPGCVDPLFTEDPSYLANMDEGCPPNVTHTEEYGYLMTTAMPVRTADGEIVGFATVDLSMNEIVEREHNIIMMMLIVFGIVTVLICLIGIFVVDRAMVRHINKLSETAEQYSAHDLNFSKISIRTGDEIEKLANSMKRMEQDIKDYYNNLLQTRNDLEEAREHAETFKREANIDPLTNIRNKRAYDLAVAELEEDSNPYAIVVFDLNELKAINDQYGHEKGNIAIQNAAKLICDVFQHSPVFRIGGDEFVAILTKRDYENRESLIEQFREEVRKAGESSDLKPWEKPIAACGYAVYDEQRDNSAASVFKRADKNMYKNKRMLKSK
ncbi:MAG: diguanylate cyclase [Clostridia bacterium]|nr:diguanylate cyclase [Clostridia bacterium]